MKNSLTLLFLAIVAPAIAQFPLIDIESVSPATVCPGDTISVCLRVEFMGEPDTTTVYEAQINTSFNYTYTFADYRSIYDLPVCNAATGSRLLKIPISTWAPLGPVAVESGGYSLGVTIDTIGCQIADFIHFCGADQDKCIGDSATLMFQYFGSFPFLQHETIVITDGFKVDTIFNGPAIVLQALPVDPNGCKILRFKIKCGYQHGWILITGTQDTFFMFAKECGWCQVGVTEYNLDLPDIKYYDVYGNQVPFKDNEFLIWHSGRDYGKIIQKSTP